MKTLHDEKAARMARAGKNNEACGGDPIVGFDGEGKPQKAHANVRMGREVTNKKTAGCDSEKDANCRE